MIPITYGVTLDLNEALKPFEELYYMQPNEPEWYWYQRTNILHRMEEDMQDDIEKCDPSVRKVVIDHQCWVECWFDTEDSTLVRYHAERVRDRVQACISTMIAEYPSRLKKFHDDLLADGEEIPVDVYQP